MTQILVRSPGELKEFVQEEAQRMGITVNALVLQILWNWKNQNDKG